MKNLKKNSKMEAKRFKCKDEVIYRSPDDNNEWIFGIFSHYGKSKKGLEYIIVNGEFYPCKPDIFEKTYEKVEDE